MTKAKWYFPKDADIESLRGHRIAVLGYGNQGRSQALNLRDSGLEVIIGNREDKYRERAQKDNFQVEAIAKATKEGEYVMCLLPDEVLPPVYEKEIAPNLDRNNAFSLASGYNVRYDAIRLPDYIDVLLVAPRMGGPGVRERFKQGKGFPCLIGVEQDASGKALKRAISLATAIGSGQCLMSSCEEETIVDLFGEQLCGFNLYGTQLAFELLTQAGCSPEATLLELCMSEEVSEDWLNIAREGLWHQLPDHSPTSQYGQMTRGEWELEETRKLYKKILSDITSGRFAREWKKERDAGYPVFNRLYKRNYSHPINEAEKRVRETMEREK